MAYVVGRIEMKRLRRSLETDEYHLNFLRRKLALCLPLITDRRSLSTDYFPSPKRLDAEQIQELIPGRPVD